MVLVLTNFFVRDVTVCLYPFWEVTLLDYSIGLSLITNVYDTCILPLLTNARVLAVAERCFPARWTGRVSPADMVGRYFCICLTLV